MEPSPGILPRPSPGALAWPATVAPRSPGPSSSSCLSREGLIIMVCSSTRLGTANRPCLCSPTYRVGNSLVSPTAWRPSEDRNWSMRWPRVSWETEVKGTAVMDSVASW